jgi:hypothetical protein
MFEGHSTNTIRGYLRVRRAFHGIARDLLRVRWPTERMSDGLITVLVEVIIWDDGYDVERKRVHDSVKHRICRVTNGNFKLYFTDAQISIRLFSRTSHFRPGIPNFSHVSTLTNSHPFTTCSLRKHGSSTSQHTLTIQSTGLPSEWEVRVSKTRQMPYYFNRETSESRWEPPPNTDMTTLQSYLTATFQPTPSPSTEKIRVRHLLVKHTGSRRPSSWKEVTKFAPPKKTAG